LGGAITVSEPGKVDPAALRDTRAQLLNVAESASAAFAESQAALREASNGWIGASKQALEQLAAHWAERDRENLASLRDLAHHMALPADAGGSDSAEPL